MPVIRLVKKKELAAKLAAAAKEPVKAKSVVDFEMLDDESAKFLINGVDAAGNTLDISKIATMTATSDNLALLAVDPPTGMASAVHAVPPGTPGLCNLTVVVTFTDGTIGPFTLTIPVKLDAPPPGPAVGVVISFGQPSIK